MPTIVWDDPVSVTVTYDDETTAQVVMSGATNLNGLSDVVITSVSNGQSLTYDSALGYWKNATGAGSGTVTSVAVSGSDGIEVASGSPITASGTIALGINASTLASHLSLATTYQPLAAVLTNTTASFLTAQETKLGNISVTQAVDLDQMETDIAALANGMVYKGNWDASAGSFPGAGAAQMGWFYTVSVGGTVDSVTFVAGDRLIATVDNASATTYASNWSQLDATDAVTSVAGRTGNVTLSNSDISGLGSLATASSVNNSNWSGTDLAVANGGTGASTEADARTSLGLAIGTDVQAHNANTRTIKDNLAASAAPTANDDSGDGYAVGSVWIDTTADIAYLCLDATLTAAVWRRAQDYDAELAAIAGLTSAAGKIIRFTGAGTAEVIDDDCSFIVACSDETTEVTSSATAKVTFTMPWAMTLSDIKGDVTAAPTGSTMTIDVHDGATTIMATNKIQIEATETSSDTATTQPTLTDTALAAGAVITIYFDAVGSTYGGAGVKVTFIGRRT